MNRIVCFDHFGRASIVQEKREHYLVGLHMCVFRVVDLGKPHQFRACLFRREGDRSASLHGVWPLYMAEILSLAATLRTVNW